MQTTSLFHNENQSLQSIRQSLRKQIREKRRALTADQQNLFFQQIIEHTINHPRIKSGKNIAVFLSFDGEIQTQPLIEKLWSLGKQIYLPVIHPFNRHHLLFLAYTPNCQLIKNRFQIDEPQLSVNSILPMNQLDVMFIPLVAFDSNGERLGMGGGFYDRTLAGWQNKHFYPIGLAHNCQQVESIPSADWDIPLPEIITPAKVWDWSTQ